MLTQRFYKAVAYAGAAHAAQVRKKTKIPYVSHLFGVASIVLEAGGTEDEAIAALLHDTIEDQPMAPGGGEGRRRDIAREFDENIATMVASLSDWISKSSDEAKDDMPYAERKRIYRDHLRSERNQSVLLVSAADKLHNARSMELDHAEIGDVLWSRFNGAKDEILENFRALVSIYEASPDPRVHRVANELERTVDRLARPTPQPAVA